jgi:hypothetical protein
MRNGKENNDNDKPRVSGYLPPPYKDTWNDRVEQAREKDENSKLSNGDILKRLLDAGLWFDKESIAVYRKAELKRQRDQDPARN